MVNNLFYLCKMRFVLFSIDKNVIGIDIGEMIEKFIELYIDESLLLC